MADQAKLMHATQHWGSCGPVAITAA